MNVGEAEAIEKVRATNSCKNAIIEAESFIGQSKTQIYTITKPMVATLYTNRAEESPLGKPGTLDGMDKLLGANKIEGKTVDFNGNDGYKVEMSQASYRKLQAAINFDNGEFPKPATDNPKPPTDNPKPPTDNPKPATDNPKPPTDNSPSCSIQ